MTNLFISYYKAQTQERHEEIDKCFVENYSNKLIDRIYILCEGAVDLQFFDSKIKVIPVLQKPTYENFFEIVNEYSELQDVNIISNSDIIFDDTLLNLPQLGLNDCWALSRWEMNEKFEKHIHQIQIYGDSQDCWIFRGKIKSLDKSDFPLGKMGCDNRIAYEIKKAGYDISNPSKTIHTWHLHNTNVRGYNPSVRNENTVVSQPYLNIPVISL